ncbi:metallophosphoesterase [Pseudoneobacillus rhizosphaerae]|uniref:metallophosphoesterase n=1 Tax=Pseudoneobacillus rhizosphaerae TaxID=2880968 RepID=UPI001E4646B9|nr:metallophosphoesterase [Pseudoneobacillus rhizosphaerae]
MIQGKKKVIFIFFFTVITLQVVFNNPKAQVPSKPYIQVRILETTDLHAKMLGYDYEKGKPTVEYGLEWTASFIKKARNEVPNSVLFDVGDVLVGNALGKYVSNTYLFNWMEMHPVYKVMNLINYDAATVGNHEFNYGLAFLMESLKGANFPYVNANIYIDDQNKYGGDDINFFNPYTIIEKKFTDSSGKTHRLKIGVIGLITPIAAEWDKETFYGKLKIKNMTETAEHFIPIMKEKGADIIVALAHVGLNADKGLKYKKGNSVYSLSKVKGVDAILYGHSHSLFPNKDIHSNLEGINVKAGTIHGIAAVQAGYWGNHLGIIDLYLVKNNGKWVISNSHSMVKPIYRTLKLKKIPMLSPDPTVKKVMEKDHIRVLDSLK